MNTYGSPSDLDVYGVAAVYLRQLRWSLGFPCAVALLVTLGILLMPRRYTATVVFTPSSQAGAGSRLAGLAAQFGLGGGAPVDASGSPDFYADLVRSDAVLQAVVGRHFSVPRRDGSGMDSVDLMAAFEVDSGATAVMRESAVEELRSRLRWSVLPKTGTVSVSVWTTNAGLSVQIIERILDEVDHFNRQVRQSQARQERLFLEGRRDSASVALRVAQNQMQEFLSRNRDFAGSPQLRFQHERLQQEVAMQQELYASLVQAYENARMEEVRGTPVLTVVQPPLEPARADRRRLFSRVLIFAILASFLGLAVAFGLDGLQRQRRTEPTRFEEVRDLWRLRQAQFLATVRRFLPGRGRKGPAA